MLRKSLCLRVEFEKALFLGKVYVTFVVEKARRGGVRRGREEGVLDRLGCGGECGGECGGVE